MLAFCSAVGDWLSWLERRLHTAEVTGSSPVSPTISFPLKRKHLRLRSPLEKRYGKLSEARSVPVKCGYVSPPKTKAPPSLRPRFQQTLFVASHPIPCDNGDPGTSLFRMSPDVFTHIRAELNSYAVSLWPKRLPSTGAQAGRCSCLMKRHPRRPLRCIQRCRFSSCLCLP